MPSAVANAPATSPVQTSGRAADAPAPRPTSAPIADAAKLGREKTAERAADVVGRKGKPSSPDRPKSWPQRVGETLLPPAYVPIVKSYAKTLGKVACGLGVVAGLSWGIAACGATAGLMRVLSGASVLDRVANSVPFIGSLLAVLMGVGGNYGFAGVGLIVFNVVDACFVGGEGWGAAFRWLRAHAAVAFALSPLWLPAATTLSLPALAGVAVGVGYLSWTVARSQETATPPSFSHALFALGICLGLSPIGAQAASGVSSINILRQAVNFPLLAFGCNAIVSAGSQLYTLFGSASGGGGGIAQQVQTNRAKLFTGDNVAEATVFVERGVARQVEDIVSLHRAQSANGINEGPRAIQLSAPSGCGKRSLASTIASGLDTRMYVLEREAFESAGKGYSGQALIRTIKQWREEAKQLGKAIVLYVPEMFRLAPRLDNDDFTSQLKTVIESEQEEAKPNLLFVLATTHKQSEIETFVDPAVENRITCRLYWKQPDETNLLRILSQKVDRNLRGSVIHEELYRKLLQKPPTALVQAALGTDDKLRALQARGTTGREIAAWVIEAVDETASAYQSGRSDALGLHDPDMGFPLEKKLIQALAEVIDRRIKKRADEPSDDDSSSDGPPTRPSSRETTPQNTPSKSARSGANGAAHTRSRSSSAPPAHPAAPASLAAGD